MISQIVAGTALAVFARTAGNSAETYYNYTIFLTGLTGILAMIPALYFYRRDKVRRIASGLIPAQKKYRFLYRKQFFYFWQEPDLHNMETS